MKASTNYSFWVLALFICIGMLSSFFNKKNIQSKISLPYKKENLTERQAAGHLLNRLTYGARPGDIEKVLATGIEKWVEQQLSGNMPEDSLNEIIGGYDVIKMSSEEIINTYPRPSVALRMAIKDGYIPEDSVKIAGNKYYKEKMASYLALKGFKPQQELYRQLINQKILRAAISNNQFQELLTDFWFNHFNVSLTKPACAVYIPVYERDVIRPNVFGRFDKLLISTAKSAAMLTYLDNFSSSGTNKDLPLKANRKVSQTNNKPARGLNENYAREVMELHTLGVDGGYSQNDVTEAAKVLTGWTLFPAGNYGNGGALKNVLKKTEDNKFNESGLFHEGDFLFVPNRHESGEKTILGKKFHNRNGYYEGVELLEMLARHPSTAKFICSKLAIRFVCDQPPASLIDKMSKTFLDKNGDIREVIITMISSQEFWSKEALRQKTKSPFELAVSAVRSLDAQVVRPYSLFLWINKMGYKMYSYQAPSGYPDNAAYWINTGGLINRMNFGLALAFHKIPGVRFNLPALNHHREPESAVAALRIYCNLMMPERDLDQTIKRLTPMIGDPELDLKINKEAEKVSSGMDDNPVIEESENLMPEKLKTSRKIKDQPDKRESEKDLLAQVVGVIIGSPEFQRR